MNDTRPRDILGLLSRLRSAADVQPHPQSVGSLSLSEVESLIAQIWADVLNLRKVNIEDNIFSLGGDSIHMVQIASRLRELFQVEVTFGEFFDAPTVADLAKLVKKL